MNNSDKKLVHIKVEQEDSKLFKRKLLESQMSSLKAMQAMQIYKFLRMGELELKDVLEKKIREIKTDLNTLEKNIPKIKDESEKNTQSSKKSKSKRTFLKDEKDTSSDFQLELQKIKEKLDSLQVQSSS